MPTDMETLRRDIANEDGPSSFKKRLVCRKGHTLMWLVQTEHGFVPVARGRGGPVTRTADAVASRLMTLEDWPAGELLPAASCACHEVVETSLYEARRWLGVSGKKVVYPGDPTTSSPGRTENQAASGLGPEAAVTNTQAVGE